MGELLSAEVAVGAVEEEGEVCGFDAGLVLDLGGDGEGVAGADGCFGDGEGRDGRPVGVHADWVAIRHLDIVRIDSVDDDGVIAGGRIDRDLHLRFDGALRGRIWGRQQHRVRMQFDPNLALRSETSRLHDETPTRAHCICGQQAVVADIAADVGDEVGGGVGVDADFAVGADFGEDFVGDDLAGCVVEAGCGGCFGAAGVDGEVAVGGRGDGGDVEHDGVGVGGDAAAAGDGDLGGGAGVALADAG